MATRAVVQLYDKLTGGDVVRVGRSQRAVVGPLIAAAGAGFFAWAARGRSASVFAPSVYRGDPACRAVALTFDDGPSPSTPYLLDILAKFGIRATFFMCGMHARRLGATVRACVEAGHEVGNHSDTHPRLWLRTSGFIRAEIGVAQQAIYDAAGVKPALFRAPYGVRWPGMRQAQQEFGLLGVMWTTIGRDWQDTGSKVAERIWRGKQNGAIYCLHDGREKQVNPDISNTMEAVGIVAPRLLKEGFEFRTVSELIRMTPDGNRL